MATVLSLLFATDPLRSEARIHFRINKHVFPNGLTLIHKRNKSNQIVALELFIKTGRIYEPNEQAGITHLVQTLLTKGTKRYTASEIAEIVESIGGILSTGSDEDFAQVSSVVTVRHFNQAFDLLFEIVTNSIFPEKEIEKERQATLAAIKSREEDIFTVAYDHFNQNLYRGVNRSGSHWEHPYALPPIGTEETVKKFTHEELVNYHRKFYTPEKMIIVIVGNLSWGEVKKTVEKTFASLPKGEELVTTTFPEISLSQNIEKIYPQKFKQAYLMFGYPVAEGSHSDYASLKVLNILLGGGMRGRLFRELRDKHSLAYEISSFYPTRKSTSHFIIYLGLDGTKLKQAKEKIQEQLKRLQTELVEEKELEEVKKFLRGNYLIEHSANRDQAWYLGWWELMGKGCEYDEKYPEILSQVTAEEILTVAKKYFTKNYLTIIIQPEK